MANKAAKINVLSLGDNVYIRRQQTLIEIGLSYDEGRTFAQAFVLIPSTMEALIAFWTGEKPKIVQEQAQEAKTKEQILAEWQKELANG